MKLNSIHQDLKELYRDKKKVKSIFTIEFSCDQEVSRVMKMFQQGYWSVMPFAFEKYNNYAIKLNPRRLISESCIIVKNDTDASVFAPRLEVFLLFQKLKFIKNNRLLNNIVIKTWEDFKYLSKAFNDHNNNSLSHNYIEDYIFSKEIEKLLDDQQDGYPRVYMDFWNHYNNNLSQKAYHELITNMKNRFNFLPDELDVDYGIWNSRVNSVLAQRAYGMLQMDYEKKEKYLWNYISQAHGYDAEGASFTVIPSSSSDTYLSMSSIINMFDTDPDLKRIFSKKIVENPLFDAIQDLRVRQRGYMGEKHVEAAAILDTEYNDSYAAWDALVTASYWAGQAGSKAIEPIWEAAIYLSEKHNWTEIHDVLVQQYAFYNHYKDKV